MIRLDGLAGSIWVRETSITGLFEPYLFEKTEVRDFLIDGHYGLILNTPENVRKVKAAISGRSCPFAGGE